MVISHTHRFIFIKTAKTAGTSIEVHLSRHCGDEDVVTPIEPPVPAHAARNHAGLWNPLPEAAAARARHELKRLAGDLIRRRRFYNHLPASSIRARVSRRVWRDYFKFCVERNPWDKTLSHYHHVRSVVDMTLDDYLRGSSFAFNHPLYTDRSGDLLVDRVLRYESLDRELAEVFSALQVPFPGTLEVRAKSGYRDPAVSYREVYSPAQRERVERIFREEIRMHGYTF